MKEIYTVTDLRDKITVTIKLLGTSDSFFKGFTRRDFWITSANNMDTPTSWQDRQFCNQQYNFHTVILLKHRTTFFAILPNLLGGALNYQPGMKASTQPHVSITYWVAHCCVYLATVYLVPVGNMGRGEVPQLPWGGFRLLFCKHIYMQLNCEH